jgi:Lectin C-type domain
LEKTYFLSELKLNWIEAQLLCRSYDMSLLEIDDLDEFNLIKDIYKQNKTGQTYIGGTNLFKKSWYWIGSGKPMTLNHTEWNAGGPDGQHADEYCTSILKNPGNEAVINDVPCRTDKHIWEFICEKIENQQPHEPERRETPNNSHSQTYIIIIFVCFTVIVCLGAQFYMIRMQSKKGQREDEINMI